MTFRTLIHGLCAAAISFLALAAVQAADMDAHHKHAHMMAHDASHASAMVAEHKGKMPAPEVKASKKKQDSNKAAKSQDGAQHAGH